MQLPSMRNSVRALSRTAPKSRLLEGETWSNRVNSVNDRYKEM